MSDDDNAPCFFRGLLIAAAISLAIMLTVSLFVTDALLAPLMWLLSLGMAA